jgi:hypothetical protein
MNLDSILNTIAGATKALSDHLAEVMRKEYERGFNDGRQKAEEEIRARITNAIGGPLTVVIKTPVSETAIEMASRQRSPRGSVEPKVLGALSDTPKGKKPAEIAAETGIPENSVRGMLNKLRKDKRVMKQGESWLLPEYDLFGDDDNDSTNSAPPKSRGAETPALPAPGPINKPISGK